MIDKNQPHLDKKYRYCNTCGRRYGLSGILIHIPSEDYDKPTYKIHPSKEEFEPGSFWVYICRWCRSVDTKRDKLWNINTKKDNRKWVKIGPQTITEMEV